MSGHLACMALCLSICLHACGGGSGSGPSDAWMLDRSLLLGTTIEIVAPGEAQQLVRMAAQDLEQRTELRVRLAAPTDPAGSERALAARIWIGDATTPGAEGLLQGLGLQLHESGFEFDGHDYEGPYAALVATFEDPRSPGHPLTVIFGNRAENAARLLWGLTPTSRTGFRTWSDGLIARQGKLTADGRVVALGTIEIDGLRGRGFSSRRTIERDAFEVVVPDDFEEADDRTSAWLERQENARARTFELLGGELLGGSAEDRSQGKLRVWLYPHAELKARMTRDWSLSHQGPMNGDVHTVHASDVIDDCGLGLARAQALALRGRPRAGWLLDGVAAASIQRWWGRPIDEWLAHLHQAQRPLSISELVAPGVRLSEHWVVPMRGALVRYLAAERGVEELRALWSGERELALEDENLAAGFGAWLDANLEQHRSALKVSREQRLRSATSGPMRRGINLCEDAMALDPMVEGYGTLAAEQSLSRASEIGADAVALVTRAWIEPGRPAFATNRPRASTPDLAVASSVGHAAGLGMRAMLKPQLLVTPAGHWAGAVMMTTPERRIEFFATLRDFALHYALLAELLPACEVLCLGSEMPNTTETQARDLSPREQPFLQLRSDGWERVIVTARAAFGGALTYSARWGRELGAIEFWPRLDFVAQNLFNSLADTKDKRREPLPAEMATRLTWALRQLSEVASEHGRPALVSEIGCSSTAQAWRDPSRAIGEASPEAQRAFYEALDMALTRAREKGVELAGVYVWNWSTDPGSSNERGFSPQNKPAERVLERIFAYE